MTQPAMPAHGPSASDAPLTMFGPDFPFAYDDWVAHPVGLGTVPDDARITTLSVYSTPSRRFTIGRTGRPPAR